MTRVNRFVYKKKLYIHEFSWQATANGFPSKRSKVTARKSTDMNTCFPIHLCPKSIALILLLGAILLMTHDRKLVGMITLISTS